LRGTKFVNRNLLFGHYKLWIIFLFIFDINIHWCYRDMVDCSLVQDWVGGWVGMSFCPFLAALRRLRVAFGISYLLRDYSPFWAAFLRLPEGCLKRSWVGQGLGDRDSSSWNRLWQCLWQCLGLGWVSRFCHFLAVLGRLRVASGIKWLPRRKSPLWGAFPRLTEGCMGLDITQKNLRKAGDLPCVVGSK